MATACGDKGDVGLVATGEAKADDAAGCKEVGGAAIAASKGAALGDADKSGCAAAGD